MSNKPHADAYLTGAVTEVAELWDVTPQAVNRAILRGTLPSRKSGGTRIVAFKDAEVYFERPPHKPLPQPPEEPHDR